ncbi:hypothetical protein EMCRGX_G020445 [Ephydatia muelleri]
MLPWQLPLLCLASVLSLPVDAATRPLTILGLVPQKSDQNSTIYSSPDMIPLACMAVNDINAMGILPGYTLMLNISYTQCDLSEGVWQLIQNVILSKPSPDQLPIMFLGGGCSSSIEPLAALTGRFYSATQVSFGSSSPTLTDRVRYPKFFRTIPSEVQTNVLRLAIMKAFNWTKVATLYQTEDIFSVSTSDFMTKYNQLYGSANNSDKLFSRSFTDDPYIPLQQIKENDVRIIFIWMYEDKAVHTFCKAISNGLTGKNHVWILPGWYSDKWWTKYPSLTSDCTISKIEQALTYALVVDFYSLPSNTQSLGVSQYNNSQFLDTYSRYLSSFRSVSNSRNSSPLSCSALQQSTTTATIDPAVSKAEMNLTTNFALSLANFSYNNTVITDAIFSAMMATNFSGASGSVTFDNVGSRNGLNVLYQMISDPGSGLIQKQIGVHDPALDGTVLMNRAAIMWPGGVAPLDSPVPKDVFLTTALVNTFHAIITFSILIVLTLLVFNIATLGKPLIANSAPHINTLIILGCLLLLATCYLLGIDSNNPPPDPQHINTRYAIICTLRLWLLTIGFSLSFGSLFGKTWQVYRVYTNPALKKEPFKMWNFSFWILGFLIVDVAYLSLWTAVWPFSRDIINKTDTNDNLIQHIEHCSCSNFTYLIGALYVYKGLLVVFGLFLAYESRNVKYFYINDSRFVTIAMYIVVILVGIGATISLVLTQNWFGDPAYSLAVSMVIAACLSCLLILYVPKFIYMAKGMDTMVVENMKEEVVTAEGLQMGRTITEQPSVCEMRTTVTANDTVEETKTSGNPNNGSDRDSGVDENVADSPESNSNDASANVPMDIKQDV